MADKTKIQWSDATWNPVTGCAKVSAGCKNCYAEGVAERFWATQYPAVEFFVPRVPLVRESAEESRGRANSVSADREKRTRPRRFTDVSCHDDRLDQPIRWTRSRRVFVNSMSDLFHEAVPQAFLDRVFAVMAVCGSRRFRCFRRDCEHEGFDCEENGSGPRLQSVHQFQILTKRPDRMQEYISAPEVFERVLDATQSLGWTWPSDAVEAAGWPLPNVHLGVSCENQETALERIPKLLATPAAVRFVSAEPLLGPINFSLNVPEGFKRFDPCTGKKDDQWTLVHNTLTGFEATSPQSGRDGPALDWVIVGGESGAGARSCDVEWIRDIVAQCKGAGVACFVKQLGAKPIDTKGVEAIRDEANRCAKAGWIVGHGWTKKLKTAKGAHPSDWPEEIRVQEFPTVLG